MNLSPTGFIKEALRIRIRTRLLEKYEGVVKVL